MFAIGQKVLRNYPVTSSVDLPAEGEVEGVVGYTKLTHTVAGPSFDCNGVTYVPVTRKEMGKEPFLLKASELYTEEKK